MDAACVGANVRGNTQLKREQTRNGDQRCDHLTEERQMVTRRKDRSQLAVFKGPTLSAWTIQTPTGSSTQAP